MTSRQQMATYAFLGRSSTNFVLQQSSDLGVDGCDEPTVSIHEFAKRSDSVATGTALLTGFKTP